MTFRLRDLGMFTFAIKGTLSFVHTKSPYAVLCKSRSGIAQSAGGICRGLFGRFDSLIPQSAALTSSWRLILTPFTSISYTVRLYSWRGISYRLAAHLFYVFFCAGGFIRAQQCHLRI
jgi:hypothetical protein